MSKQDKTKKKAQVHPDLEGLDFYIDSYGKVNSTIDRDKIHEFLNKEMPNDKKLNSNVDKNED